MHESQESGCDALDSGPRTTDHGPCTMTGQKRRKEGMCPPNSPVTAVRYSDVVRFAVQNAQVEILRAEVFDLRGKRLFDSGPVMGNALDWNMSTEADEQVARELTASPGAG